MDSESPVWGLVEDFFKCSNEICLDAFMATEVNKISSWQLDNVLLNMIMKFWVIKSREIVN